MGDVTNDPFAGALDLKGEEKFEGINFKLLNTPAAREAAKKRRELTEQRLAAKEASQKRMAEHLKQQVEDGEITNDWECEFIDSVYRKTQTVLPYLSEKQDSILTRLFEKY